MIGYLGDVVYDVDIIIDSLSVLRAVTSGLIAGSVVCRTRKRIAMLLVSRLSGAPSSDVLASEGVDLRLIRVPCTALLVVEATSSSLIRVAARVGDQ